MRKLAAWTLASAALPIAGIVLLLFAIGSAESWMQQRRYWRGPNGAKPRNGKRL